MGAESPPAESHRSRVRKGTVQKAVGAPGERQQEMLRELCTQTASSKGENSQAPSRRTAAQQWGQLVSGANSPSVSAASLPVTFVITPNTGKEPLQRAHCFLGSGRQLCLKYIFRNRPVAAWGGGAGRGGRKLLGAMDRLLHYLDCVEGSWVCTEVKWIKLCPLNTCSL